MIIRIFMWVWVIASVLCMGWSIYVFIELEKLRRSYHDQDWQVKRMFLQMRKAQNKALKEAIARSDHEPQE